jgi:hypothetical protein
MGESEPLFSATLLLDQLSVMRELYGDARVNETIAALPESVRRELAELAPSGWCSVSTVTALKTELARRIGDGPLALQRRVVARGMERTLNGFWRFFLARLSDPWILKFAPLVYSKSFDRGSLVVERIDAGRAEIVVRGWADMPEFDCVGLASGIETFLTLAHRARPKLTWMRRGAEVRFVAMWNQGGA